jgi:hypothetical protein
MDDLLLSQDAFSRENDEAELEQLYRKKYGGLLKLTEEDAQTIALLERRKFYIASNKMVTPSRREDSQNSQTSTSSSMTTSSCGGSASSFTTTGSTSSSMSKVSKGLAKILSENRAHKHKFAETRITDVEREIFAMETDFYAAAEFHAPFLNLMKSFLFVLSHSHLTNHFFL